MFEKILTCIVAELIRNVGNQCQIEVDNLKPYIDPKTNVKISYKCAPTLIDGKVRMVWSDVTTSYCNCPLCGAKPEEMGKPRGDLHDFTPNPDALKYSCCGLHGPLRSFDFFCKNRFHWDFKCWACV